MGSGRTYKKPTLDRPDRVHVERLPGFAGYDVVLSTRIEPNIRPLTPARLAELAITSAKLRSDGKDGISYLIAAKANGIVTGLSEAYENEILAQLKVQNLTDALAAMRAENP